MIAYICEIDHRHSTFAEKDVKESKRDGIDGIIFAVERKPMAPEYASR